MATKKKKKSTKSKKKVKKAVKKKATKKKARKKTTKKKAVKKKATKKKAVKKKKRKPNPAFMKKFKATPILQAVVGASSISRPQATKKIWEYIKKHKLQDKVKRTQINVGGTALGKLFPGKKSIRMFDLPKGVGANLKD